MLSSETCKNYFVFVTRRHAGAGTGCKRLRSLMFRKNHVCSGCSCDFSAALLIELLVAVLCFELIVVSNVFTFIASSVSMFSSPLLITPLLQNLRHSLSHAKFAQTVIPHLPLMLGSRQRGSAHMATRHSVAHDDHRPDVSASPRLALSNCNAENANVLWRWLQMMCSRNAWSKSPSLAQPFMTHVLSMIAK